MLGRFQDGALLSHILLSYILALQIAVVLTPVTC